MFALIDKATGIVLSQSHNTTRKWIIAILAKRKIIIWSIISQSWSQISISFDVLDIKFGIISVKNNSLFSY